MTADKCPPNDDACVGAGFPGGFQTGSLPPCDHILGEQCYYFHIGTGTEPRDSSLGSREHCELPTIYDDLDAPAGNRPCGRMNPGWYRPYFTVGHWVRFADSVVTFMRVREGDSADFTVDSLPFRSRHPAILAFVFDPTAVLEIDACCLETDFCGVTPVWIGRARFYGGGIPWGIWCNVAARVTITDDWASTPSDGDIAWCRQSIFRALRKPDNSIRLSDDKGGTSFSGVSQVPYTTRGMVSIVPGHDRGFCFPTENQYCFVRNCGDHSGNDLRKHVCVEEGPRTGDSIIGTATDIIEVTYSMRYSINRDAFEFPNEKERDLENVMLEFFALKSSGEIAHSTTVTDPASTIPFTWTKTEVWDESHPDGVENPVLEFAGQGLYSGGVIGQPVAITGKSLLTGIDYPMEARLTHATTWVELHIEKLNESTSPVGTHKRRLFAEVSVEIFFQMWLTPAAYTIEGPLRFLKDITEPWDHRFADPTNPSNPYPYEQLVIYGPNGERVRRQITWKGRICETPIGRGAEFEHPCISWYGGYPVSAASLECCSALQAIDAAEIPGRLTDMSGISKPQLFEGNIVLTVPMLNTIGNELHTDCGCND